VVRKSQIETHNSQEITLHRRTVAFLLSLSATLALAQVPNMPQFSADMKMGREGDFATGKMYWGGNRMRMDMTANGHDVSMIHDPPKKISYMIMPEQKMYMELSANSPMLGRTPDIKLYDPSNPCAAEEGYTCKKVGAETVNGRSCDKWEFTGSHGNRTVWIDQKLHFPLRTVSADGHTFDLTNVKEGSQPASLFEIPSGFTKLDMGGGRKKPD
jgi:hypothetical protein